MHQVLANYTLPAVLNTLQPATANGLKKALSARTSTTAGATSSTTTTTGTTSSTADGGLGSTFLSLLATELQNQDPTAPVDSTEMVGQMISLNQLDQLISINQTLTTDAGAGTTGSGTPATGNIQPASSTGSVAPSLSPSAAAAAAAVNQLPFDPNTLMPLNFGNPAVATSPISSAVNPSTGSSATNSNTSGGK